MRVTTTNGKPRRLVLEQYIKQVEDCIREGKYDLAIEEGTRSFDKLNPRLGIALERIEKNKSEIIYERVKESTRQIAANLLLSIPEVITSAYLDALYNLAAVMKVVTPYYPKPVYFFAIDELFLDKLRKYPTPISEPNPKPNIISALRDYFSCVKKTFFRHDDKLLKSVALKVSSLGAFLFTPFALVIRQRAHKIVTQETFDLQKTLSDMVLSFLQEHGETIDPKVVKALYGDASQDFEKEPFGLKSIKVLAKLRRYGFPIPSISSGDGILKQGSDVINAVINYDFSNEDAMMLIKEGSRRPNANFIIPLGKEPIKFKTKGNLTYATVSQGIVFKDEKPYIVNFPSPLPVHYLAGHDTENEELIRKSGIPLTTPLEHTLLDQYFNEKDITMMALSEAGIKTPKTISIITKKSPYEFINKRREGRNDVFYFEDPTKVTDKEIETIFTEFLKKTNLQEAVLKPSNSSGGKGIVFFDLSNISEAIKNAKELILSRRNFIVQERIVPPECQEGDIIKDWNIRAYVPITPKGRPKVRSPFVRFDEKGKPINICQGADSIAIEAVEDYSKLSSLDIAKLKSDTDSTGINSYYALKDAMHRDGALKKGENPIDFMAVDLIVRKDERLVPYVMEANEDTSGGAWDVQHYLDYLKDKGAPIPLSLATQTPYDVWIDNIIYRGSSYKSRLTQFSLAA